MPRATLYMQGHAPARRFICRVMPRATLYMQGHAPRDASVAVRIYNNIALLCDIKLENIFLGCKMRCEYVIKIANIFSG